MNRLFSERSSGFILPVVIMLGLAIMILGITNLQVIATNSTTLNNQYYNQLAHEAAMAGATVAKSCIAGNYTSWTTLSPQSSCVTTGTTSGSGSVTTPTNTNSVGTQDNWSSDYNVTFDPSSGTVVSTGRVQLYSNPPTNTTTAQTFTSTVKVLYTPQSQTSPGGTTTVSKDVHQASAGQNSMCAVAGPQNQSWVYCWGDNSNGQLGTGTTNSTSLAKAVVGAGVAAVNGVCADGTILTSASMTCPVNKSTCLFGNFGCSNYAVTTPYTPAIPGSLMAGHNVTQVARGNGNHTCAIADGKAYCWGQNNYGQLGNGTTTDSSIPVPVLASAASPGKCASGASYNYGDPTPCSGCLSGTPFGNFCFGGTANSITQQAIPGSPMTGTVTDIVVSDTHTCAVADAQVYCWGNNSNGQLGNNTRTNSSAPVAVSTAAGGTMTIPPAPGCLWFCNSTTVTVPPSGLYNEQIVTHGGLSAGESHTCVFTTDNTAHCWGKDQGGQLGDGIQPPNESGSVGDGPSQYINTPHGGCNIGGGGDPQWTPDTSVTDALIPTTVDQKAAYSQPWQWGGFTLGSINVPASPLYNTTLQSVQANGNMTTILANNQLYWFGGPDAQDTQFQDPPYMQKETCTVNYLDTQDPPGCDGVSTGGNNVPACKWKTETGSGYVNLQHMAWVYHMQSIPTGPVYSQYNFFGFTYSSGQSILSGKPLQLVSGSPTGDAACSWFGWNNICNQSTGGLTSGAFCTLTAETTPKLYCDGAGFKFQLNYQGQLGNGATSCTAGSICILPNDAVPVDMTGVLAGKTITGLTANARGDYTCVVAKDSTNHGAVYCWGSGYAGRTGMGDTNARSVPTSIQLKDSDLGINGNTPGSTSVIYVNPITLG